MSEPFERRLAERTLEILGDDNIGAGDRLVAEFTDSDTAGAFIEAIYEVVDREEFTIEFEDETQSIPGFSLDGELSVFTVRVRSDDLGTSADWSDHDVTQGYATTLRNELAFADVDAALLLAYQTGVEIDTLDTTRSLFDDDGLLPMQAFREDILENVEDLDKQGRALMKAVREHIGDARETSTAEIRTLCAIRDCLESGDTGELPDLISKLGGFIREDRFSDWSGEGGTEEQIQQKADEILQDNQRHAARFEAATEVGVNTREKLLEDYEDDFVNEFLASGSNGESIDHTQARNGTRTYGGSGGDGPGPGKPTPTFESIDIQAEKSRVHSVGSGSETRRGVLAVPSADGVTITLEFSADIEGEPTKFTGPDGGDVGELDLSDRTVTATISDGDDVLPRFASLKVYIGHKQPQGNPKCQIDLAVLPHWFFDAVSENALDVDVEEEALVSHDESPVTLTHPASDEKEELHLEEETLDLTYDYSYHIIPNPPAQVGVQVVAVHGDGPAPVEIRLISEVAGTVSERVDFPLAIPAIVSPDAWGDDQLRINESVSIDLNVGELHPPNRAGVEFPEEDLRLLQIEEEIRTEADPRGREVDSSKVGAGEVASPDRQIPGGLEDAYGRLFDHFESRDRTPSTDRWDEPTKRIVGDVLNAYEAAVSGIASEVSSDYDVCRKIGTIDSQVSDTRWITPYHPVMLAYGLRVAQWRDEELLPAGALEGFKNDRFVELLNPTGLLPYGRTNDGDLLQGRMERSHHFWMQYDQIGGIGSQTPDYMDQVVRDKLDAFRNAFPILFNLHEERNIVINLIQMGDLGPVIKGLFNFIKGLDNPSSCPNIVLRIYGGPTEGEELEKFFSESAQSSIQESLEKRDKDIVDLIQRKVLFVRKTAFTGDEAKPAHITFFRGMLDEKVGKVPFDTLPAALHRDGLIPQESIQVKPEEGNLISRVGFGDDPSSGGHIHGVSRVANALEAKGNDAYQSNLVLSKTVSSNGATDLDTIWDLSLWVSHVEPKVGIDFYLESEATGGAVSTEDSTLMIHYSDQYDAASPNFDVITTTRQRDPYVQALQTALREHDALDQLAPETVLRQLVSIDGALALDLLRAEGTRVTELIGFIGGLAVSRSILEAEVSDHVWIPVSLAELARHDRSKRGHDQGILQYDPKGPASDDICLVGIPKAPEGNPALKLWLVETKGGHASIPKGRKQVINGWENLRATFHPEEGYSDIAFVRAEFGKLIHGIASRLESYGVLSEEEIQVVEQSTKNLKDGEYEIEFLRDDGGHIGEVIRVQPGKAFVDYDSEERVRSLVLPMEAIRTLREDVSLREALDSLPMEKLSFDERRIESRDRRRVEATSLNESEEVSSDDEPEEEPEPVTAGSDLPPAEASGEEDPGSTEAEQSDSDEKEDTAPEPPESESDEDVEEELDEDIDDQVDSASEDSDEERELDMHEVGAYDWSSDAFQELTSRLDVSPEHSPDINVSKLVDDLTEQFESLGVDIHRPNPADVSVGPRKIGVNVHPKRGQKIEGILKSLNSVSVHIQAHGTITGEPNPAEGAVRIEIPHGDPRDVYLREAFEALGNELFNPLVIPLGVTSDNQHRTINLIDENHVLVAGSTGSGKSNYLAGVVTTLGVVHSPEELSMSLLDPKGVDFGRFSSLPHVGENEYIDSPRECANYLFDLVENEIPRRQKRLQRSGATNIVEHNELIENGTVDGERLTYRVIVIDEYADLQMSLDEKDVLEEAVTRIAQKGRAMGYIMLLATQRPSADIVSGKIKANFPCRISFKLPSNTDSRVILDKPGAEDLEGAGDMIAITKSGRENHVQAYRLMPSDAIKIRDELSRSE
jgi:hypothetical protein